MAYDFYEKEDGTIYGDVRLRSNNDLDKDDIALIDRMVHNKGGVHHYNVEHVAELQRRYGSASNFQTGLLNGALNFYDDMKEVRNNNQRLKAENKTLIDGVYKATERIKQLEAELKHQKEINQQLIYQNRTVLNEDKQRERDEIQQNKDQQIIQLYMSGYSQRSIAKMVHVSATRVSNIIKTLK